MTFTSPAFSAANPFLAATVMFDQQMRLYQAATDMMLRANPWLAMMMRTSGFDPLTADSGLSAADSVDEMPLDAGVASETAPAAMSGPAATAKLAPARPAPEPAPEPAPQPAEAATVTAFAPAAPEAAPKRSPAPSEAKPEAAPAPAAAASGPKSAAKSAPKSGGAPADKPASRPASAAPRTARSARPATPGRARRKPSAPPAPPSGGDAPEGGS
ncbi:hypothetical protein DSD19_17405 [Rhodovulum sp. BSW8]|uniref:hypothetical protein n=1 Tax=Rhodovulum sp. BSW8 TaxID=2259645 RepID=UPI000DE247E1|nr:hypothetical protein [Rhodovulum sp. BSW8]RBO51881.1 hypothetical protein DSD19_17405 [Rhodovulum sp. BSW8]